LQHHECVVGVFPGAWLALLVSGGASAGERFPDRAAGVVAMPAGGFDERVEDPRFRGSIR